MQKAMAPRQRGQSLDSSADAPHNGPLRPHVGANKSQGRKQQQIDLSALADDDSSQSDSDRDLAKSMSRLAKGRLGSGTAKHPAHSDSCEDEVGLSSNLSSDDEASDTSQDDSKQILHPEHAGRAPTHAASRRASIRSSTLRDTGTEDTSRCKRKSWLQLPPRRWSDFVSRSCETSTAFVIYSVIRNIIKDCYGP